ncbi:MAG: YggT family protein [Syntrophomonadaceae bacterium]|nr:YggT family protein [Syntrophomonadaceae bacterium]
MGLISLVNLAFELLSWLIIARCILSFVRHNPYQPVIKVIYDITEPILGFFRRLMPSTGMIDFSPLVALLAIILAKSIVIRLLVLVMY